MPSLVQGRTTGDIKRSNSRGWTFGLCADALICVAFVVFPARSQEARSTFESKSREVLLDIVVQNKHGKPVRDLDRRDLEIYEDGRLQQLTSFRLVGSHEAHNTNSALPLSHEAQSRASNRSGEIRLVSLVFDRLTGDQQRSTRRALDDLLASAIPQDTYVAVFVLDRRLYLIQSFTNDQKLLRDAAMRATSGLYSQYVHDSEQNLSRLEELYLKNDIMGLSRMDVVILRTLRDQIRTAHYQEGRVQMDALLSLVRYQNLLPGRKAVIYFSQGLSVPTGFREALGGLISTANRSKVSFYALDVRGLQATPAAEIGNKLTRALESEGVSTDEWQPETLQSEFNSTQMSLGELATKTGGFLISNSNDMRTPLRRIWDQLHTYYEASYRPARAEYDGRFHRITVRVLRPGVTVQSRNGYYALPDLGGRSMLPYEAALVQSLNSRPLPAALPFRAAAVCYRAATAARCVLTLSVPLKELKYSAISADRKSCQVAFLALIRDSRGEVANALSRDLPFEVPAGKKDVPDLGNFTRTETVDLLPGTYTLEIALQDRQSTAFSAKRISLHVPVFQGLALSQIIRARSIAAINGQPDPGDPLEFSGGRVTPDLSSKIEQQPGAGETLYFVVYPELASTAPVELATQIIGDRGTTGESAPKIIGSRQQQQAMPYLVTIPIDRLEPGGYLFQATVRQGGKSVESNYAFEVVGK